MKKEITKPLKNEEKHTDNILEAMIAYKTVVSELRKQLQPSKSYLRKGKK